MKSVGKLFSFAMFEKHHTHCAAWKGGAVFFILHLPKCTIPPSIAFGHPKALVGESPKPQRFQEYSWQVCLWYHKRDAWWYIALRKKLILGLCRYRVTFSALCVETGEGSLHQYFSKSEGGERTGKTAKDTTPWAWRRYGNPLIVPWKLNMKGYHPGWKMTMVLGFPNTR